MKAQNKGVRTLADAIFNMDQRLFPGSALPGSPVFALSLVHIMSSPVVVNGATETWLGGDTRGSIWYGLVC
jgi:hypothetical protein